MRELHLFAGAGGGILGGMLLGHTPVCAVEIEPYCRKVLLQRQRDGLLPRFPIWDDVRTYRGSEWQGKVDLICGGFPCQDISAAGKGAGITGSRSGLWSEFARIIREVRPRYAFIENSPNLTSRGLDVVLSDLASLGFDAEWGVVSAADTGAPHQRDRIWILAARRGSVADASSSSVRLPGSGRYAGPPGTVQGEARERERIRPDAGECGEDGSNPAQCGLQGNGEDVADTIGWRAGRPNGSSWWSREPAEALLDAGRGGGEEDGLFLLESQLGRVAHGMAHRVDRLRAIGNGQVPQTAALAFRILWDRLHRN